MFNLLKSDLFRLVRGKMLWISLAVLFACALAGIGTLTFITSTEFADMITEAVDVQVIQAGVTDPSSQELEQARQELEVARVQIEALSDRSYTSFTCSVAYLFFTGGVVGIIAGLVAGLFIMSDFSTGFAKSLLSSRRQRLGYYAEKLVLSAIIAAIVVIASMVFTAVLNACFGFTYKSAESAGSIILWAVLAWLVVVAYNTIAICVGWLSRSKVAAVLCAVFLSSTVLGSLVVPVIDFVGLGIPALANLVNLLPYTCLTLIGAGSEGLLESQAGLLVSGMSPAGQIVVVCGIYIAALSALSLTICRRKDI